MTQQEVRWTADQVLALAPDAASRAAGSRLGAAGSWSGTGSSSEGAVWGVCAGGGGRPHRTAVDLADPSGPAYTCSCRSRRAPCRHALGLLLLWADGKGAGVPRGRAPDWAGRWIRESGARAEREGGVEAAGRADGHGQGDGGGRADGDGRGEDTTGSGAGTSAGAGSPGTASPDAGAALRRAERRAGRITAGAMEMEQRLADLLRGGLAAAHQAGPGPWEETAARMVDAQAPGLASRARESGAVVSSGQGWPVRLLEECAMLHLLARGWLHRDRLPAELAAAVRSRVGLTARAEGPPLRDRWLVLAQYDTADAILTTRRIWLYGTSSGRTVLLLSYGAAGRPPEMALPVGMALDAEVSAYPWSSRGALGERFAPPEPTAARPPGVSVTRALARYGEAVRRDPWRESVPVTLDEVVPVPDGDSWQLADSGADAALPLTPAARTRPGLWRLVSLSGGAPVRVFGTCGHRGFTPLAAWPEGTGAAVALY